jgi:hypothetical protein
MKAKLARWWPTVLVLLGPVVLLALARAAEPPQGATGLPEYSARGRLLQTLNAFDNPEGAVFSDDGRFVFVSNAAELGTPDKGFHWTERGGFVSKLAVNADGTLAMANPRLITGLTAPLGMAVTTVATAKFPKGSIVLCTGGFPLATAAGTPITDPRRLTSKLVVFDVDGKILGEIGWDADSPLARVTGGPATLPNAAGFDTDGNLYVADSGIGGGRPGLLMIPHGAIDDLASGRTPTLLPVFLPVAGLPDGVEVSPVDGTIHLNTVGQAAGAEDPAKGGMWRLTREDVMARRLPSPFRTGLGALDGLAFTARGTRLDTQILQPNYITVVPPGSDTVMTLAIDGLTRSLAGPADIAILKRSDGTSLLVIPELSALSPNMNDNPVDVVLLPADA